jgi:hypothetical protein
MKLLKIFFCNTICLLNSLKAQLINANGFFLQNLKKHSFNYYSKKFFVLNTRNKHGYTLISTKNAYPSMSDILTNQLNFNGYKRTMLIKDGFTSGWFDNSNITK